MVIRKTQEELVCRFFEENKGAGLPLSQPGNLLSASRMQDHGLGIICDCF